MMYWLKNSLRTQSKMPFNYQEKTGYFQNGQQSHIQNQTSGYESSGSSTIYVPSQQTHSASSTPQHVPTDSHEVHQTVAELFGNFNTE